MRARLGQGAIEWSSATTARPLGQGATEYLVLLAVVLVVALVSVALLGFFPGMAGDSQRAQSEMYWRSASPVAITEWAAKGYAGGGGAYLYFRVKNNLAYPIRITSIVGGDGSKGTIMRSDETCGMLAGWNNYNISDYYYLAPGEEKYFGYSFGLPCNRMIIGTNSTSNGVYVGGATSVCADSNVTPGMFIYPSMGFEYIEYLDNGQQITKRQVGKQVIIKCLPPA
jgi:hypothetical protein